MSYTRREWPRVAPKRPDMPPSQYPTPQTSHHMCNRRNTKDAPQPRLFLLTASYRVAAAGNRHYSHTNKQQGTPPPQKKKNLACNVLQMGPSTL